MKVPSASAHFQPDRQLITQLVAALGADTWDQMNVPVAYAVLGGVRLLEERLGAEPQWAKLEKRFLVGIDWFRSEPLALDALAKLPKASLRVVDGTRVVDIPGCRPVRSYHPKAFIFSKDWPSPKGTLGCLVGSGNLSKNGLSYGHELDLWSCSAGATHEVVTALADIHTWFEDLWSKSTPYHHIRDAYRTKFEEHQRTDARATTDDDSVPDVIARQHGLKPDDLVILRSFDNLWIDTGSMYSNLGEGRSGNQLDLRRYTRVFFGFPAQDLATNSPIGSIAIMLGGDHPYRPPPPVRGQPNGQARPPSSSGRINRLPEPDAALYPGGWPIGAGAIQDAAGRYRRSLPMASQEQEAGDRVQVRGCQHPRIRSVLSHRQVQIEHLDPAAVSASGRS